MFGGLHLVALGFACVLFWMFLHSETVKPWEPPSEDEDGGGGGGGGNDRLPDEPKRPDPGGVPLPDARQAPVRLREPGRLADAYEFPQRRRHPAPEREPERV